MQCWGTRWREKVRLACGTSLERLPIPRHRCATCKVEVPWLPAFLLRWRHYAAEACQEALEDYASSTKAMAEVFEEDGPSFSTVARWVYPRTWAEIERWLETRLQALESSRERAVRPEVERE